jgi:hypothetical protein
VTTLTRFAPPARRTIIRAGMLASDYGRGMLSTEFFLLALAEGQLQSSLDLGITAASISAGSGQTCSAGSDQRRATRPAHRTGRRAREPRPGPDTASRTLARSQRQVTQA